MKRTLLFRGLCVNAVIAALYAVLTLLLAPVSYGPVQFRASEALVILCAFRPSLGIGLTLGCFLANLFSSVTALDMIFGTLATALACLWTGRCRKLIWIPVPNILTNAVIVGAMLAAVLSPEAFLPTFGLMALQVGAGELAVMYGLGIPLALFLKKTALMDRVLPK